MLKPKRLLVGAVLSALVVARPPFGDAQDRIGNLSTRSRGALSGTVVDGDSGVPIAEAVVSLFPTPSLTSADRTAGTQRQLTDGRGRFVFNDVGENSYRLVVSKPGFFDGGIGQDSARDTRRVRVVGGEWLQCTLKLFRPAAISGFVFDERGEPIVRAYVRALAEVHVLGRSRFAAGTLVQTNDLGEFRLYGLRAGRYLVTAPSVQWTLPEGHDVVLPAMRYLIPPRGPDGRLMTYPAAFFPESPVRPGHRVVDLRGGEEVAGVRLDLRPVAAVRVQGVLDAPAEFLGSPVPIRLVAAGLEALGSAADVAVTLAEANGSFTLDGVPAGDYTLIAGRSQTDLMLGSVRLATAELPIPSTAAADSYGKSEVLTGPPGTSYTYRTNSGHASFSARWPIHVGDRDMRDLIVPMRPTSTLRGRLRVEPPGQNSMVGGVILAEPSAGSALFQVYAGSLEGASGSSYDFTITGVEPGQYFLTVPSLVITSVAASGRDHTDAPLDTTLQADYTSLVVTASTRGAGITGMVRHSDGTPADEGSVVVFPSERRLWAAFGANPRQIRIESVALKGAFRVDGLPPGDYFVAAVEIATGYTWPDPEFLASLAARATRVALKIGEVVSLDLRVRP